MFKIAASNLDLGALSSVSLSAFASFSLPGETWLRTGVELIGSIPVSTEHECAWLAVSDRRYGGRR